MLTATSHARPRAHDRYLSSTLIGGKGGAGPSSLRLRDQRSEWMRDGCEVYVDSYVASNGSCFMVTWSIFKNHLLEVGLTQNRRSWHFGRSQPVIYSILLIMCEDPAWIKIHWNSIWLRAKSHMSKHYTWGSVTTLHDFGGVLGRLLDTFFWALTISWARLLAHVWRGSYSNHKVLKMNFFIACQAREREKQVQANTLDWNVMRLRFGKLWIGITSCTR